jgi:hypothetical protein
MVPEMQANAAKNHIVVVSMLVLTHEIYVDCRYYHHASKKTNAENHNANHIPLSLSMNATK